MAKTPRALRTDEEIAAVPPEEAVTVDLTPASSAVEVIEEPPEPPPKVAALPDPEPDEPPNPLLQQLDALKASEEALKRQLADTRTRAETAEQNAQRAQTEAAQNLGAAEQAQYDSIVNAMNAANAEAESAEREIEAARNAGDMAAERAAFRKLARAEGRLENLEQGKAALDQRREEMKAQPRPQSNGHAQHSVDAVIDQMQGLSGDERTWLKQHPDAMTNPRLNAKLQSAYWDAQDAGHVRGTPAYFQFLEEKLGYRQAQSPPPPAPAQHDDEPEPPPQRRAPTVSAPVSRDVPSAATGRPASNKVTLTPAEREAAAVSGISEIEYARQKQRLQDEKKRGNYMESR